MKKRTRRARGPVEVHVPAQDLRASVVPQTAGSVWMERLKRQGEIAIGLTAMWMLVYGFYVGIVTLSGGHIVPLATPRKMDDLKTELLNDFRKELTEHDKVEREKTERDIKAVRDDKNLSDCEDYNGRLDRAAQELMKDPNNDYQRRLYQNAAEKLNRIPDCKPIVLPIMPLTPQPT